MKDYFIIKKNRLITTVRLNHKRYSCKGTESTVNNILKCSVTVYRVCCSSDIFSI